MIKRRRSFLLLLLSKCSKIFLGEGGGQILVLPSMGSSLVAVGTAAGRIAARAGDPVVAAGPLLRGRPAAGS